MIQGLTLRKPTVAEVLSAMIEWEEDAQVIRASLGDEDEWSWTAFNWDAICRRSSYEMMAAFGANGEIEGLLALQVVSLDSPLEVAYIQTAPGNYKSGAHRRGVGTVLMVWAAEQCEARDFEGLSLSSEKDAELFYEKMGFDGPPAKPGHLRRFELGRDKLGNFVTRAKIGLGVTP